LIADQRVTPAAVAASVRQKIEKFQQDGVNELKLHRDVGVRPRADHEEGRALPSSRRSTAPTPSARCTKSPPGR
jgi:hypothetical protein